MNLYETMAGLHRAAEDTRREIQRVDRIVQEVNGKVMRPSTPLGLRTRWSEVYGEWSKFSLSTPLLRDREPRMTREDLRDAYAYATRLKEQVLDVYRSYKDEAASASAAAQVSGAAPVTLPGIPASNPKDGRVLRGVLIGAAVVSGCAAATVLWGSFRKKEVPPPAPRPLPPFRPISQMMVPMPVPVLAPPMYPAQYQYPYGDDGDGE